MEFIKLGKRWLVKNSGGRIVSEKEKLELENKELVLKDIKSNDCQKETTKKISKNKKRIKEIEEKPVEELVKEKRIELFRKDLDKITNALQEEVQDDIIEEADTIKE